MQCKDYITGRLSGKLSACQEKRSAGGMILGHMQLHVMQSASATKQAVYD